MLKPAANEIHLWLCDDGEVRDADLLDSYRSLLNPAETQRWQRYYFERHRHQYLVTRALVRSVLANYEGMEAAASLTFRSNAHGKPALTCQAKTGLHFNVSHCQGLVALAVAREREVGVDVEFQQRKSDIDSLARRYFSPQEYLALEDLGESKRRQRFFDFWTLKEAYIKACGLGLAIPLDDFCFHVEEKRVSISFTAQRDDDPARWGFWLLRPGPEHKLALAVTGKAPRGSRLVCRRGVPLRDFHELKCEVLGVSE